MDFNELKEWIFLAILGGGVKILYSMKLSVEELNVKMAVIIERTSNHEKRIENLETRKHQKEIENG